MSTPAGASLKAAMLAWVSGLKGKNSISVQHILGQSTDLFTFNAVFNATSQWPGGIGGGYYNDGGGTFVSYASNAVFIDYWNKGGIVIIDHGLPNPMGGGPFAGAAVDVNAILTPGTPANQNWVRIQTEVATGLLQLQNAGVAAFYRPLHEANGNWNWYGTAISDADFRRLWQDHWKFMVNTMGLTSLNWVYAKNASFEPAGANRFPGASFCDLVGVDGYTDDPAGLAGDVAVLRAMGKPMVLAEFGSGGPGLGNGNFDMMTLINALKGPLKELVWWDQWHDGNGGNLGWGMDEVKNLKNALADPWVLTRGNLGRPTVGSGSGATIPPIAVPPVSAPPAFTPSPDGTTIYSPVDPPIINAVGESYTLLGTLQCGVGGVHDATSANVARMLYQGGFVYHQNNHADTYRTARSADPWLPTMWPVPTSHTALQAQIDQAQRILTAARLALAVLTP